MCAVRFSIRPSLLKPRVHCCARLLGLHRAANGRTLPALAVEAQLTGRADAGDEACRSRSRRSRPSCATSGSAALTLVGVERDAAAEHGRRPLQRFVGGGRRVQAHRDGGGVGLRGHRDGERRDGAEPRRRSWRSGNGWVTSGVLLGEGARLRVAPCGTRRLRAPRIPPARRLRPQESATPRGKRFRGRQTRRPRPRHRARRAHRRLPRVAAVAAHARELRRRSRDLPAAGSPSAARIRARSRGPTSTATATGWPSRSARTASRPPTAGRVMRPRPSRASSPPCAPSTTTSASAA